MNIKLDTLAGSHISEVLKNAKEISIDASEYHESVKIVEFDFNGIKCLVDPSTDLDLLYRDYCNAHLMEWETIGINCVKEYSRETKELMEQKTKEAKIKSDKSNAEYRAKNEIQRRQFEEKVKGIEVELINIEGWNKTRENNKDSYGKATMDFAEGWAKLMQVEIKEGKTISQCSDTCMDYLGFMGISGAMYGFAKGLLKQCWKYGYELK